MFLAFTNELKYNRFACGSTEQEATSALLATLTEERESVFWACSEDFEAVAVEGWEIQIRGTAAGTIHTCYSVLEVTESGCAPYAGNPITMNGWWEH